MLDGEEVDPPVMVHEHVHDILEEVRLLGAEESPGDLIHGLFQLREIGRAHV